MKEYNLTEEQVKAEVTKIKASEKKPDSVFGDPEVGQRRLMHSAPYLGLILRRPTRAGR